MQSICPSHTITSQCGSFPIAREARSNPKRTFDFLNITVSGELTYLPEFFCSTSWRPENATTRPCLSRTVNMSRPPKRWYPLSPGRFGAFTTPAASSSSGV